MNLIAMTMMASLLILVVIVIRSMTINKIPKATFLILWAIVLVRLLLPVSFSSSWSIYNWMNTVQQQSVADNSRITGTILWNSVSQLTNTEASTTTSSGTVANSGTSTGLSTEMHPESSVALFNLSEKLALPYYVWIWLSGAIGLAAFFIINHWRWRTIYRASLPVNDPFIKDWLAQQSIMRKVRILQSDQISSPLTYGIIRPVILLPKGLDYRDGKRLKYMLTHEMVHIKRWDLLSKWILTAALCLHWFNPLVWVMYRLANRDLELSCDENVVKTIGLHQKSAYALTLLDMEDKKIHFTPTFSNFSKNLIEERIKSIMKLKKTNLISFSLAGALVAGTTLAFATSAADKPSLGKYEPILADAPISYAEHINEDIGEKALVETEAYKLAIDSTLFTDHNVYAVISLQGVADEQPEISGRTFYPNFDVKQTSFQLTGDLTEIESVDDVRYFLYSSTLARTTNPLNVNEDLVLAAGDNYLKYNSLRDYEGNILELTVSIQEKEYPLYTPVQNVWTDAIVIHPDAKHYEGDYFDTFILTPWELKLHGTSSQEIESTEDMPHLKITLQFKDGHTINFSYDTRGSITDEGYPVGMSRGSGDNRYIYHNWNFREWEIDLEEVKAIVIDGVKYPVNR